VNINCIYNMDCFEGMSQLASGSVNLVLTDPPYGCTANSWDVTPDLNRLWGAIKSVLSADGSAVMTSQTPFDKVLGASNLPWLRYEWIWKKTYITGHLQAKIAPLRQHENILVFTPATVARRTYNPQGVVRKPIEYRCDSRISSNYGCVPSRPSSNYGTRQEYYVREFTGYPKSVLEFGPDPIKLHPTQKPLELMRYMVRTYSNPGDLVLDPFMGSGTTAIACVLEHRNFIGFELDTHYWEVANKRLRDLTGPFKLYGDIGK
jgi:site-specific DNA-methyltransferase (adenine-specific)